MRGFEDISLIQVHRWESSSVVGFGRRASTIIKRHNRTNGLRPGYRRFRHVKRAGGAMSDIVRLMVARVAVMREMTGRRERNLDSMWLGMLAMDTVNWVGHFSMMRGQVRTMRLMGLVRLVGPMRLVNTRHGRVSMVPRNNDGFSGLCWDMGSAFCVLLCSVFLCHGQFLFSGTASLLAQTSCKTLSH